MTVTRRKDAIGPEDANAESVATGSFAVSEGSDETTRERILAAAGPVFASYGFDGATVRQISREAGVNVASIAYHFGDKMGLYLELIRRIQAHRQARFPLPDDSDAPPQKRLENRITLLLSRLLQGEEEGAWETQLLMREMQKPTVALGELVEHYFRPFFVELNEILRVLMPPTVHPITLQKLAFSVVGQCLYYQVGGEVVRMLITEQEQHQKHFSLQSLSEHITRWTLAGIESYTRAPFVCFPGTRLTDK